MKYVLCVLLMSAVGCVNAASVTCGDRVCPAGTRCDDKHALCVFPEQTIVCATLVDGDVCTAAGTLGICNQGYCVPGCGDGITNIDAATQVDDECDDGNFKSHDGCSSTCASETATWVSVPDPWAGRFGHASAYMTQQQKLVVYGGIDIVHGLPNDQWERDTAGRWHHYTSRDVSLPSARFGMAMAYGNGKIVLFGGRTPLEASSMDDTWEYDGTAWTKRMPSNRPSARFGASMVFDSTRNKIILFGGFDGNRRNDLWEYDVAAATWSEVTISSAPPPVRVGAAMAYDSARQLVVVFGGATVTVPGSDTWEYNPTAKTWSLINTGTMHPDARYGAAATYLPGRGMVLFGGQHDVGLGSETLSDSWEYDGAWTKYDGPQQTPPGRYGATLTFDVDRGAVVLVGGASGDNVTPLPDVWEYFAALAIWTDASPQFPPARETPLTYDAGHNEVVGFAGDLPRQLPDTWAFDGGAWTEAGDPTALASSPAWRKHHVLAYDSARDRVVMYGGQTGIAGGQPVYTNETWEWNGDADVRSWTRSTAGAPTKRSGGAFAFDAAAGVSVLFGGHREDGTPIGETWEYNGSFWAEYTSATGPPAQGDPAMAFDPDHQRIVLFDESADTYTYANHTWTPLDSPTKPLPQNNARMTYDPARQRIVLLVEGPKLWQLDDDGWHRIRIVGQLPPPRLNPGFAAHGKARQLLLFGGSTLGSVLGDTWSFQFRSETAEEICDDGIDNDHDLRIDTADPDCD